MKKYFLGLLLTLCSVVAIHAETWTFRTTNYAIARVYNGSYQWSDWQSSDMVITINLSSDVITVYSPKTQRYRVVGSYNNGRWFSDNDGGQTIKYYVVDQDGDRGHVRLRVDSGGTAQIYVDFNDVAWCYCVRRVY